MSEKLVILSDGAGQFNILEHALCWVHAERSLTKLVGFNDEQREVLEETKETLWQLYQDLKTYQKEPEPKRVEALEYRFRALFGKKTCFTNLNKALERLLKRESELLRALERPEVPLHNNSSERDIREYVKRRKISGSTRSEEGRRARDTFVSLKKTCRKLGISFWDYLKDRISGVGDIQQIPIVIAARASPE